MPFRKRDRPEIEELTGQRWVPVLVHGDEVIHDSHRILEYLDWLERPRRGAPREPGGARERSAGAWPLMLMAWERWQALSPEQKERYKRQAREYAERGRKALDDRRAQARDRASPAGSRGRSAAAPARARARRGCLGLLHSEQLGELAGLEHLHDDVRAADQLPSTNSCGIVGQPERPDSSSRMRGSGRMSSAAYCTPSALSAPAVRAEKPQAGWSGVPFMNSITRFSSIACSMKSRISSFVTVSLRVSRS